MKDSRKDIIEKTLAAQEGTLSEAELSEFESHLLSSPESREVYLSCTQVRSALETLPPDINEIAIEQEVHPGKVKQLLPTKWGLILATAAALALFLFAKAAWESRSAQSTAMIATLLLAEDCQWEGSKTEPIEGQRLLPGKLRLQEGTALLRFDSGAELVMSGNTHLELLSPDSGRLLFGEVVIRAEDGAEGFRLDTPGGEMTDLGTEFAVKVLKGGETELHVHEGKVSTGDAVVAAGNAVSLQKGASSDKDEVPFGAPDFEEVIRKANPKERRDLMTAYEGFHVDEGLYATSDMNSGKGWSSPWRLRTPDERGLHTTDSTPDMLISHGQMNVPWPVRGGQAGMLEFTPGLHVRIREMKTPIDFSTNKITYFSFLAAEAPQDQTAEKKNSSRDGFRITFRSSADYFGESVSIGWSNKRQLRTQSGPGSVQRSIRKIPTGETVFVVGKFTHSKRDYDEITFRFYRNSDSLDFTEPAVWDVVHSRVAIDAKLDLMLITSQGKATRFVDELRIGPTWRSVTPIDFDKVDSD